MRPFAASFARLARIAAQPALLLAPLAAAACSLPDDPNAHPPLAMTLTLERDTIAAGDSTVAVIVARNPGSSSVTVHGVIGCTPSIRITDGPTGGRVDIGLHGTGRLAGLSRECPNGAADVTIAAGDSVVQRTTIRTVPSTGPDGMYRVQTGSYALQPGILIQPGFVRVLTEAGDTLVVR